jgi:hypothetical protein
MRVAGAGLLLSTDCSAGEERISRQIVSDWDWIHVQFRMDGDGYESLSTSNFHCYAGDGPWRPARGTVRPLR